MDMSKMSAAERAEFERHFQEQQMKEFISMYNLLTNSCFDACINEFTSRKLSAKQKDCVQNCAQKFFQASQRINLRFAEAQQAVNGMTE